MLPQRFDCILFLIFVVHSVKGNDKPLHARGETCHTPTKLSRTHTLSPSETSQILIRKSQSYTYVRHFSLKHPPTNTTLKQNNSVTDQPSGLTALSN